MVWGKTYSPWGILHSCCFLSYSSTVSGITDKCFPRGYRSTSCVTTDRGDESDVVSVLFFSFPFLTTSFKQTFLPFKKCSTISIPHLAASFSSYSAHPSDYWFIFSKHNTDHWLLVMSTQLIGFSIGGICKHFLVSPSSMIWPQNLATAMLFSTLHSQETSGSRAHGGISCQRFLFSVFVCYFFYSQLFFSALKLSLGQQPQFIIPLDFLPSYLFTALLSFSWVCWIAPHNAKINQLFGVTVTGAGLDSEQTWIRCL